MSEVNCEGFGNSNAESWGQKGLNVFPLTDWVVDMLFHLTSETEEIKAP